MHMTKWWRWICVVGAAVLLAGCPSAPRKSEAVNPQGPLPAPDLRGATLYQVDAAASTLAIQVMRGGALARLGHNHVMSSKTLSGRVWMNAAIEKSGFELSLPVNELIVDDPETRRAAGPDFPPDVPREDREGTRKNMLRLEVLDGERFPTISIRSVALHGALPDIKVVARITIKDRSRDIEVPTHVIVAGTQISATGAFDILQTDFGIKPFSIGLGALEVLDKLHIEFKIVAQRS